MRKTLLFLTCLIPSVSYAQRMGTIKSSDDVSVSSNTVLNTGTEESKQLNVTSGTVVNFTSQFATFESTAVGNYPVTYKQRHPLTSGVMSIPLYHDNGSGYTIRGFTGYNFGGSSGTEGYFWSDLNGAEKLKLQTSDSEIIGFGVSQNTSGTMRVKNTIDNTGSWGVPTASTTVSMTLGTTHFLMLVNATAGDTTITMPDLNAAVSSGVERRWYRICKTDSTAGRVLFDKDSTDSMTTTALTDQYECIDYIGRVGLLDFGSNTAGVWQRLGHSYDAFPTGNDIVAAGVIGSAVGSYNFVGTTLTFAAPPIDTLDRVPILNNGSITWPVAVTAGSSFTWTGSHNFTSPAASTFTSIIGTSITLTGLTANTIIKSDGNKALASVSNSGADGTKFLRDDFTWQSAGSGSSAVTSTGGVTMDLTFTSYTATNIGVSAWPMTISSNPYLSADYTIIAGTPTIPDLACAVVAGSTYTFIGNLFYDGGGSGGVAGVKYWINLPLGSTVSWRVGGPHNAATATRFDQGNKQVQSLNSTALSAYSSQTRNLHHITGGFVPGVSGTFSLGVSKQNTTNPQIEAYSNLHIWQQTP